MYETGLAAQYPFLFFVQRRGRGVVYGGVARKDPKNTGLKPFVLKQSGHGIQVLQVSWGKQQKSLGNSVTRANKFDTTDHIVRMH